MQANSSIDLQVVWDQLLSREPERVKKSFQRLDNQEQHAVHAHLERMANEPGWHPEQRESAQAALKALAE